MLRGDGDFMNGWNAFFQADQQSNSACERKSEAIRE
jgi:hypothetical protein